MAERFQEDYKSLSNLTYNDLRQRATNEQLSMYEKIGFPDSFRKGYEKSIYQDIAEKIELHGKSCNTVLDIGCGCTDVVQMLIDDCDAESRKVLLIDSQEMLSNIRNPGGAKLIPGYFPDIPGFMKSYEQSVDRIIVYSVIHTVFEESNLIRFVDSAIRLLADQGKMIIGDIPNQSKKYRLLRSPAGKEFHKKYMGTEKDPEFDYCDYGNSRLSDSVLFSILCRARELGCESYILPQPTTLPMHNRREDIVIYRV